MGNKEDIETLDLGISKDSENIINEKTVVDTEEKLFDESFMDSDMLEESEQSSKKPKSIFKLIISLIIVILIFGLCIGLYIWNSNNNKMKEKAIKEPALDYFDKYMSANTGAAAYKVTLDMLKEANKNGENYKLDVLNDCDGKNTMAIINIDYSNGEVTETEIKLSCKIF